MADKNQHIDDYFRKRLENSELPVGDSDWQALADRMVLSQKEKRKAAWWWTALIALMLASTALVIWKFTSIADKSEVSNISESGTKPERSAGENHQTPPELADLSDLQNEVPPSAGEETSLKPNSKFSGNSTGNSNGKRSVTKPENPDNQLPEGMPESHSDEDRELKTEPETPHEASENDNSENENNQGQQAKKETEESGIQVTKMAAPSGAWFAFVSFGPGTAALNPTGANATSQFEALQAANNAGIRPFIRVGIGRKLGKWNIQGDVDYSSLSQTASYSFSKLIFDSVPVFDPNGQVIGYFFRNYRDTAVAYSIANNVGSVGLSVLIERDFRLSEKSGIMLGLGGGYAFNVTASGTAMNPVSLYKNPLTLSQLATGNAQLNAHIRYRYAVLPRTDLFAGTAVRQRFGDFYRNAGGYQPTLLQLEFGLRFNLK